MVSEIYRVLKPSGRYITFSLHVEDDLVKYFINPLYEWQVRTFNVRNSRWDEYDNSRRNVAHTMIVCDKPDANGNYVNECPPHIPGVLTDDELLVLTEKSITVSLQK